MEQTYHLVWTRDSKLFDQPTTKVSEPLSRDTALQQFANVRNIRESAAAGQGRIRVMSTQELERLRTDGAL